MVGGKEPFAFRAQLFERGFEKFLLSTGAGNIGVESDDRGEVAKGGVVVVDLLVPIRDEIKNRYERRLKEIFA